MLRLDSPAKTCLTSRYCPGRSLAAGIPQEGNQFCFCARADLRHLPKTEVESRLPHSLKCLNPAQFLPASLSFCDNQSMPNRTFRPEAQQWLNLTPGHRSLSALAEHHLRRHPDSVDLPLCLLKSGLSFWLILRKCIPMVGRGRGRCSPQSIYTKKIRRKTANFPKVR